MRLSPRDVARLAAHIEADARLIARWTAERREPGLCVALAACIEAMAVAIQRKRVTQWPATLSK